MNKDNAREYLPLVQALAEGKTIQGSMCDGSGWYDIATPLWDMPPCRYRIKPEPVKGWYRVALVGGSVFMAENENEESYCYALPRFRRWLTDRIEYEVEA